MNVIPSQPKLAASDVRFAGQLAHGEKIQGQKRPEDPKLRKAFDDFVGQTFYSQMLSAMRSTVKEPAYFHGGRAEEVFQSQLDQVLAEKMADASADQFTQPMFDLFTMSRR